jgi:hypothetical protein
MRKVASKAALSMEANDNPSGGGGNWAMTSASEPRMRTTRLPRGNRSLDQ